MAFIPPRRVSTTPTSVFVSDLPAWLPAKGYWSGTIASGQAVSLNRADDSGVKGDFPPAFPVSRSFGNGALWDNYSGGVWNPHIGTYGAYLFHGGGHSATSSYSPMLDNAVYMWRADTRQWSRLTDPTYPGDVSDFSQTLGSNYPWGWSVPHILGVSSDDLVEADEPLKTYGELRTNVPCSNHSRSLLCIMPPSNGGGTMGSLVLPQISAAHITGAGNAPIAHKLDCAAAISLGSAAGYQAWARLGPTDSRNMRAWAGCVDTFNGYVYSSTSDYPGQAQLLRYNLGTGAWSDASPSGWGSAGTRAMPIEYAAAHHMLIVMRNDFSLRLMNADAAPMTLITPSAPSGTPPSGGAPTGGEGGGFVWCPDLGSYGAVVHYNYTNQQVKACYAPSNPLSGAAWQWVTLSANNTPTPGNAIHWYKRFQYAPALKSFFLCSMPTDAYGGIVCFRPSEIA